MKQHWKKKMVSAGWLTLTFSGMMLLIAGVTRKNEKLCKGINVEITGTGDHFFVEEKEMEKLLNANGKLAGQSIESINLRVMESRLENDKWIRNAELFFDNNQVLQVVVEERQPVARIFTVGGYSYYIDSSCQHLPLSDKLSARVPMFTNFPSDRTRLGKVDSTMMVGLKDIALYINKVPFWEAQVAQIHINPNRELEMVPTIGNHTVQLGRVEDYEAKFNRLYTFYKEVWPKVGLEKYEKIDVQFKGQVVASKRGSVALQNVDSAKARRALDELMAQKRIGGEADAAFIRQKENVSSKPSITTKDQADGVAGITTQSTAQPGKSAKRSDKDVHVPGKTKPVLQQTISNKTNGVNGANSKKVPKAVMKKRAN